jgi:uncharacterized membrane protein
MAKRVYVEYILFLGLLVQSCHSPGKLNTESGKVIVQSQPSNNDGAGIIGSVFDFQTGKKLMLSDVWIGDERYACDSTGNFSVRLSPGKYDLEARSFGFENFKYPLSVSKGKTLNLLFYLVPFKNRVQTNPFH